jgi:hypothetical protein
MRLIFGMLLIILIVACADRTETKTADKVNTTYKSRDTTTLATKSNNTNLPGFGTDYMISRKHKPFLVTGYFNQDNILDTAILIRHKLSGKDALFIKHSDTAEKFLIKTGKDVGHDFDDLNWVGNFKIIQKGTKIFDAVVDGEIVGEDKVAEHNKVLLKTDAIFMHEDEGGGGGIIYFKNGRYIWVQQD